MRFESAAVQLRVLLFSIVRCPDRKCRPFRVCNAQCGNAIDELGQPACQMVDGPDHQALRRYLPQAKDHGYDKGQETEGGGDAGQHGIIEVYEQERRRQENHR